jgi:hypothetical protein
MQLNNRRMLLRSELVKFRDVLVRHMWTPALRLEFASGLDAGTATSITNYREKQGLVVREI